jgi:hypothetical protein
MEVTLKEVARTLSRAADSQPGIFDLPSLRCVHCGRQGVLDTRGEHQILMCSSVLARCQSYFEDQRKQWDDEIGPFPKPRIEVMFLYGVPLKSFECTSAESDVVLYLWPKPESLASLYS